MLDEVLGIFGRPRQAPLGLELPTGKYEIIGSHCRVRVDARRYPKHSRMFARLIFKGRTAAFAELAWQKNMEYAGSLDLEDAGGVTPRDILTETAFISVEDQWGRSARLPIDGASQLSLARQHLDRDRDVLQSIDFTAAGNSRRFVRSGFSGPEAGHCWTDGSEAELVFPSEVRPGERYELGIEGWPFLLPAIGSQGLTVELNGRERALFADRNSPKFLSLAFAGDDIGPAEEVALRLQISHPGRSCDVGDSKDARMLGFAVKQIVFSRLLDI